MMNDVAQLLEDLEKSSRIVVDVETYKTDTFEGKTLMGVAFAIPYGIDILTHYIETRYLGTTLQELRNKELIFHNAKFDLQILEENGYKHEGVVWDTMIMAHLVNENRFSFELDSLASTMLGERKQEKMNLVEKAFSGWHKIPPAIMGEYAQQDVRLTMRLFTRLYADLEKQNLLGLWPDCEDYIRTLKNVCAVGIDIDWDLLAILSKESQEEMRKIEKELGFTPTKRKELERYLFDKLGVKKSLSTNSLDDATLRSYAEQLGDDKGPIETVLRYRKLQKADGTWYRGFEKRRCSTGRIHPGLKQHGTRSGRLSCSEPNLQQIPRDAERVKALFRGRPGFDLIEFDYSQIELRAGSRYAKKYGDERMFNAYMADVDVHHLTSQLIRSYDVISDKGEARQVGKTGNFLWIYGGSADRLQNMLWIQYKIHAEWGQCQEWTDLFHNSYPGFKVALKAAHAKAQKTGYVQYWNKRRRHLGKEEAFSAFNQIVQGGCGQIIMMALNDLDRKTQSKQIRSMVCNTVHDSVWALVPTDDRESEIEIIKKSMSTIPERVFDLPFPVDHKVLAHAG